MEHLKQLGQQIKWQFIILHRNNLIGISIAVTALYAAIFFAFKDFPYMQKVLTLLLYNDPSLIGLLFFGLAVILEKNQQVLPAFFVTPMNVHHYLLARVLSLSILGWACAFGMGLSALGFSFHYLNFSMGVFFVCILFSLAGVFLISFTTDFLSYMLFSIPVMFVLSLPLLNYYELSDIAAFRIVPTQGATNLLIGSYESSLSLTDSLIAYVTSIAWILLMYWGAYKMFMNNMRQRA